MIVDLLNKLKNKRPKIAVVGDFLIDKYYKVDVKRISPEVPIKVLHSEWHQEENPECFCGGSGNVSYQLQDWKADIFLFSILGTNGTKFVKNFKFNSDNCVHVDGWKNPEKRRFHDGDFPISRYDVEDKQDKTFTFEWNMARIILLDNFEELINNEKIDVVILSDYDKGLFVEGIRNISRDIIDLCGERNIKTIVDPKSLNLSLWKDCYIFKPNYEYVKNYCKNLHKPNSIEIIKEHFKNIVATDGGNGVYIDTKFIPSPELSEKRPIIRSVSGAGDNFSAFLALSIALDFSIEESTRIAFNAASAYVEDKHNLPLTMHRLHKWYDRKILQVDDLAEIREQVKNKKWVMTNGCLDAGLTAGHIETFKMSKKKGDYLIVAVNSDESVRSLKGEGRPILPLQERMKIIAAIEDVDYVVSFNETTPLKLIGKIKPDLITKGGDYKKEDVCGYGITEIEILPYINCMSTTDKIRKML
jgi:D-beta-D-heptose 7-phosphate kinase/D-beta-D-heptose 1-phosphate adenosyltransferase